ANRRTRGGPRAGGGRERVGEGVDRGLLQRPPVQETHRPRLCVGGGNPCSSKGGRALLEGIARDGRGAARDLVLAQVLAEPAGPEALATVDEDRQDRGPPRATQLPEAEVQLHSLAHERIGSVLVDQCRQRADLPA